MPTASTSASPSPDMYERYETVIGLEIHVQLSTHSKAFCADDTRFGAPPNTQVSAISLGHPGTLPRLNRQHLAYAVRLALALGSEVNLRSTFDRKNYFYADLPKGYQITQDRQPICTGGHLDLNLDTYTRRVRLHHIHMEEDAGKSIHDAAAPYSYVDLNRAGVPLLEIVTEPDLRSAEEVDALMTSIRQLVRYLDICDGNLQEGSLRCDCNVSVRLRGSQTLGQRCEIKNLNSMRYARRAIEFEMKRQIDLLEAGGQVAQQTLNFDPVTGTTAPLRDKEDAHDYRYFPDPDLPPVIITPADVAAIKAQLPVLPAIAYKQLTTTYGLGAYEAGILTAEPESYRFFLELAAHTDDYRAAANLMIHRLSALLSDRQATWDTCPLSTSTLAQFIAVIGAGVVSHTVAYNTLLPALADQPEADPAHLAEQLGIVQLRDEDFLITLTQEVLAAYPDKVTAYRKGKKGLLGLFMGEVMKRSGGKAEPTRTKALLQEMLDHKL